MANKKWMSLLSLLVMLSILICSCNGSGDGNGSGNEETTSNTQDTSGIDSCDHRYEGSWKCTLCKQELGTSVGLEYSTASSFGFNFAVVTGIGTCTDTDLIIPYKHDNLIVREIDDCAFRECNTITSVLLPNTVKDVGIGAFSECTSLASVTFADYSQLDTVNVEAFQGCKSLEHVDFGADTSLRVIGMRSFENCTSLTSITIPKNVKFIKSDSFLGCKNLFEVYNLSSLEIVKGAETPGHISYYALDLYTSANAESKLWKSADEYLFYKDNNAWSLISYMGSKTELTLPASCQGNSYRIYENAFKKSNNLTSVTIPDGVETIGKSAFAYCPNLTNVTISSDVTSIGESAFEDCSELLSVTVSPGLKEIGASAFKKCTNLTSIEIPNSVTSIGHDAFYDCESLAGITIPNGITTIASYTFFDCSSLTSVILPNSVTNIEEAAFHFLENITAVFYGGTEDEWENIEIGEDNYYLTRAARYYYAPDGVPDEEGNYWHYNAIGVPTPW
ncbi:MAG: leucine-rich repeat domain-containing protein [Clostridia bacterium]|nr:leucine-rich repeat domain-containing protein [Clostridia bacterium]